MIREDLQEHAAAVQVMVEGMTRRQVEAALQRLCQAEAWELIGVLLITAQELPARMMIDCLCERGHWSDLVPCACLRREIKQPILQAAGGGASRVFRDVDTEEDSAGIPEHIMAEAEDIANAAARRRETASVQAASVDRDPLREHIVNLLAAAQVQHPEATQALAAIARASAWEETRRLAALKVVNNPRAVQSLLSEGRTGDLVTVARHTGLASARQKVAQVLGDRLAAWQAAGDQEVLRLLAEDHPEEELRRQAAQALPESS